MHKQAPIETNFSQKPEPSELLKDISLAGKIAIVTGGYSGIGLETVRALTNAGATVIAPARDVEKAKIALDGILDTQNIAFMDLSDINSIDTFATHFADKYNTLDILINNAGVMACPLMRTKNNWEWQVGINHFGHAQLFHNVLPLLQQANGARFVSLSSSAHRISPVRFNDIHYVDSEYEKWQSYGQSKTACSLFAITANEMYANDGIESFAVHPGGIFTPLQRHLPDEEMVALGWKNADGSVPEAVQAHFKSPSQGAATSIWCATSPLLSEKGGVFCENCNISEQVEDKSKSITGVRSWAVDPNQGHQLMEVTASTLNW